MKRILVASILLLVILGGCGPSQEDVQKAISQTQTAAPTATQLPTPTPEPTPIPVPLGEIDLESLAILSGDLPAGYSSAQVDNNPPEMFNNLRGYANALFQQFEHEGDVAGGVTIMLFDSIWSATAAYNVVIDGFGEPPTNPESEIFQMGDLESPGERASFAILNWDFPTFNVSTKLTELAFIRCHAVVHIRISDTTKLDYAVRYGERLDERLAPLVCD